MRVESWDWSEPISAGSLTNWSVVGGLEDDIGFIMPAVAVRYNERTCWWEIALYGWKPNWRPFPSIRSFEEAKATAVALWQIK